MLLNTLAASVFAGFVMHLWMRIIAATDFGKLSWPFAPLEYITPMKYNQNVRIAYGVLLWVIISMPIGLLYWVLVQSSMLSYYTFGSALTFGFFLWIITVFLVFPLMRMGLFGFRHGKWLWLESAVAWLLFSFVFDLLIA